MAWLRVETARKWGRKLYGPSGYRLIPCGAGKCAVYPPTVNPDEEVRAIVRGRAPWILAHASDALLDASPKRFVSGETLPYLGRNVRMVLEFGDVRSPEVRFDHCG